MNLAAVSVSTKDLTTSVEFYKILGFEFEKFSEGTNEIALFLSGLKAKVIIGGGDSAVAIKQLGLESEITYISTGGGAFLQFLSGKKLPAINALEESAS